MSPGDISWKVLVWRGRRCQGEKVIAHLDEDRALHIIGVSLRVGLQTRLDRSDRFFDSTLLGHDVVNSTRTFAMRRRVPLNCIDLGMFLLDMPHDDGATDK